MAKNPKENITINKKRYSARGYYNTKKQASSGAKFWRKKGFLVIIKKVPYQTDYFAKGIKYIIYYRH